MPKENAASNARFYNGSYVEGVSATIPSEVELENALRQGVGGNWGGDYNCYLPILAAAGVLPGQTIEDFGAAWGYGCYQLRSAGYQVFGYEIDQKRARFASDRLGIRMIADGGRPEYPVDCFVSAHVLEHLPNPSVLWQAARSALRPGGTLICFMPNGDPEAELNHGSVRYHKCWGNVHPLMVTSRYLRTAASQFGFVDVSIHSSPYDLSAIRKGSDGAVGGMELALIARQPY